MSTITSEPAFQQGSPCSSISAIRNLPLALQPIHKSSLLCGTSTAAVSGYTLGCDSGGRLGIASSVNPSLVRYDVVLDEGGVPRSLMLGILVDSGPATGTL